MINRKNKMAGALSLILIVIVFIAIVIGAYIMLNKMGIEATAEKVEEQKTAITTGVKTNATTAETDLNILYDSCQYEVCEYHDKCDGEIIPRISNEDTCCKGTCIKPTEDEINNITRSLYK